MKGATEKRLDRTTTEEVRPYFNAALRKGDNADHVFGLLSFMLLSFTLLSYRRDSCEFYELLRTELLNLQQ